MDTVITSAANPIVKQLRRLVTSPKARRDEGLALAEGAHLVRSLLTTSYVPTMYVVADSARADDEVAGLVAELETRQVRPVVLADSLFASIASIHAQVGVAVVFSLAARQFIAVDGDAVVLEDVQDPGNLGTIMRTVAAAGISSVMLSSGCASPWSPKALRSGMGAQFSIDIYEDVDVVRAVSKSDASVLVTSLLGESVSLYEADLRQPTWWVFGNEGQGVSDELLAHATTRIAIPQAHNAVESLNVAAATAVCLYEQVRQRLTQ